MTFLPGCYFFYSGSTCYEALKDHWWISVMQTQIYELVQNCTWEVVPLPKGKKPNDCRWLYNIHYQSNGAIERYKANLLLKGKINKKAQIIKKLSPYGQNGNCESFHCFS